MRRFALCAFVSLLLGSPAFALDVALSFEDAPSPETPLLGPARAATLTSALAASGVEEALFLAVGTNIEAQGTKRLAQYAAAGHIIGSQGYSRKTVDELGATAFVKDMKRNDLLVRNLPGFKMWFRFPSLVEGSTVEARDTVRVWIYHMLYGRTHVTIDTPDEALNRLVQAGVSAGRHLDVAKIRRLYVTVLMACVQHYDRMALEVLGYSPPHTIRLHENDLAAAFIGDFVAALRQSGGRIIKASDALADDLNKHEANVVPLDGSQIIAVAHERGISDVTHAPIEEPTALDEAFGSAGVWE
jgi:peptidoglycan/xylan/chitin deacetylase (PgdA/CDA1 family)